MVAAVVDAERIAGDFEPRPIVPRLEEPGSEMRRRVIAEVGGNVADPQPLAAGPRGGAPVAWTRVVIRRPN